MHVAKFYRTVFRLFGRFTLRYYRSVQHFVYSLQSVADDQIIFAHIHNFRKRKRNYGRDYDIENKIEQKRARNAVVRKPQRARNQKREYAVDRRRVKHHRKAQVFGIRNHPLFVFVDRAFEFFERIHRLTESFHHGDSADVFYRFVGHIFKRVVILFHLFRHTLARHRRHNQKCEKYGNEAQKPQSPVEYKQQ